MPKGKMAAKIAEARQAEMEVEADAEVSVNNPAQSSTPGTIIAADSDTEVEVALLGC
jgi:hypothetical protein